MTALDRLRKALEQIRVAVCADYPAVIKLSEIDDIAEAALDHSAPETSRDAEDAARYRFLRQPGNAIVYAMDRNAWGRNASGHVNYDKPERLDAAIDAAIGAQKTSTEGA